ncbi:MAG: hypothetical protein RJA10_1832 [Pseudomonadota bacterium]|jgi:hypothetical protein
MRVSCPSCNAECTLDVLLNHQLARQAVARLVKLSLPFGAAAVQYVALFKPASRALSFDRIATLLDELHTDISRGAITRKGREWPADADVWKAAIDIVLAKRDAQDLRLPLAGHGLLHEVIVGLVEKAEARSEAQREADRRNHRPAGPRDAAPRDLAALAADVATSVAAVTAAPDYSKPSRAALEIRARIEAATRPQRSDGADLSTPPEPTA